ncbi:hypothetical protein NDU88_010737 [Pleurodeles waltl]|uniref:Uncharacterized protein n=1 Tax=Pleurodeles waltl TaxID=8319 RepID=A0AAV7RZV1_PLEWA|nr:hypothetical protein NDU88_010737 [Pleurodeles waltl]
MPGLPPESGLRSAGSGPAGVAPSKILASRGAATGLRLDTLMLSGFTHEARVLVRESGWYSSSSEVGGTGGRVLWCQQPSSSHWFEEAASCTAAGELCKADTRLRLAYGSLQVSRTAVGSSGECTGKISNPGKKRHTIQPKPQSSMVQSQGCRGRAKLD